MISENTEEFIRLVKEVILEKKGEDVRIIDISNISSFADYFIIASGKNIKQIQTIADTIEEKLSKKGKSLKGIEGYKEASWVLMDYDEFVIHIFSSEDRLFYDLEHIWSDGLEVTI